MQQQFQQQITCLILAGGRGQRMNGADKGLMLWHGKPLIEHLLAQLNCTTDKLIISANRNLQTYQQYADTVIEDKLDNFQGPLAGILTAMQSCSTDYLLCLPCDSPTPPLNLLDQLWLCKEKQDKTSAVCHDGDQLQPLFSLLHCQHLQLLASFLQQGRRKVRDFISLIDPAICDFSAQQAAFSNFNRPEDMQQPDMNQPDMLSSDMNHHDIKHQDLNQPAINSNDIK